MSTYKLAVLISGKGSNAKRLIEFLPLSTKAEFIVISTKENVSMRSFCHDNKVLYFEIDGSFELINNCLENIFLKQKVTHIVLAGFLKKISSSIITRFEGRIINLHPSLLPKFGGKGMYGRNVHQAVFDAKEKESGITIHQVNEIYDEGRILAQYKVPIILSDTVDDIEQKVQELEKSYFPEEVLKFIIE